MQQSSSDGKIYNTKHYNLKAIIAVGHKVDSPKAVQFRKWANAVIEEFTIKGFAVFFLDGETARLLIKCHWGCGDMVL